MKKIILMLTAIFFVCIVVLYVNKVNFKLFYEKIDNSASNMQTTVSSSDELASTLIANTSTTSAISNKELNDNDFPVIKKAVLYKNGIAEEILPDDSRIIQMVNYIMLSREQKNYVWVRGVIENSTIEGFYKPRTGMYLVLDLDSQNSVEFNRYDSALVSYSDVIMIDSDSPSYHGEGNPFNYCFTPYFEKYGGYENTPDILNVCGFE